MATQHPLHVRCRLLPVQLLKDCFLVLSCSQVGLGDTNGCANQPFRRPFSLGVPECPPGEGRGMTVYAARLSLRGVQLMNYYDLGRHRSQIQVRPPVRIIHPGGPVISI